MWEKISASFSARQLGWPFVKALCINLYVIDWSTLMAIRIFAVMINCPTSQESRDSPAWKQGIQNSKFNPKCTFEETLTVWGRSALYPSKSWVTQHLTDSKEVWTFFTSCCQQQFFLTAHHMCVEYILEREKDLCTNGCFLWDCSGYWVATVKGCRGVLCSSVDPPSVKHSEASVKHSEASAKHREHFVASALLWHRAWALSSHPTPDPEKKASVMGSIYTQDMNSPLTPCRSSSLSSSGERHAKNKIAPERDST